MGKRLNLILMFSILTIGCEGNFSRFAGSANLEHDNIILSEETFVAGKPAGAGGGKRPRPTATPSTFKLGERKTLAILVNFRDKAEQPFSVADVRSMIFGTIDAYIRENSNSVAWLGGDVTGWHTLDLSYTDCTLDNVRLRADEAAINSGYDLSSYAHLMYFIPQTAECHLAPGTSTLGRTPSWALMNINELKFSVVAHEFGHGLGLGHAHALDCGSQSVGANCTSLEYGDVTDLMGSSNFMHFNAFHKERLGWLNTSQTSPITTVLSDGVYSIAPYASTGPGAKALKILKSTDATTGVKTWYYIEAHQPFGFEDGFKVPSYNFISQTNYFNGLAIHLGTDGLGNTSYLLDMTPNSNTNISYELKDGALIVGNSFVDPATGLTIRADSIDSSGAVISVSNVPR